MNIKPVKDYKKPRYAAALASLLAAAGTMTGCMETQTEGVAPAVTGRSENFCPTEVQLDGDVILEGDVEMIPEETEITIAETEIALAGDIAIPTEPLATTGEIAVPGMVVLPEESEPTT